MLVLIWIQTGWQVFLKFFFEKINFEKSWQTIMLEKLPSMQSLFLETTLDYYTG